MARTDKQKHMLHETMLYTKHSLLSSDWLGGVSTFALTRRAVRSWHSGIFSWPEGPRRQSSPSFNFARPLHQSRSPGTGSSVFQTQPFCLEIPVVIQQFLQWRAIISASPCGAVASQSGAGRADSTWPPAPSSCAEAGVKPPTSAIPH